MKIISFLFPLCLLLGPITISTTLAKSSKVLSYEAARNAIIQSEERLRTGGNLHLNANETKANEIFLKYKYDELSRGFKEPTKNAAGLHFFKAKPIIDRSKVYKFIKQMPKGALLHTHTTATVSSEWVVKNIFYMPGLLRCTTAKGLSVLSFRKLSDKHGCTTQYVKVSDERIRSISYAEYDRALEKLINLYTPTPELEYPTINDVWTKFQNMFRTMGDAFSYLPAFRSYHWQMFEELYQDNVMYAELRMNFYELYDISGRTFPMERSLTELQDIIERFKSNHPNFLGAKIIYSPHRNKNFTEMTKAMDLFKMYYNKYPKLIAGFDLVGQEDLGKPLYNYVDILANQPQSVKYFFHAGETDWYGSSTDFNLLDAVLLNTTRIGHGYALMKHPVLWNAVKKRDIAIEVSPISNQVLHLVWDLRNHPGAFFISQNIPLVICNDDPGFWNAKALSYDYYYAIMSFAPNYAGLSLLKQLVWNSIKYSVLDKYEKQKAYKILQRQWDHFVDDVVMGLV